MLEVINGFLLVYFLVLCLLNNLMSTIVKPIAACFTRPSEQERILRDQYTEMLAEQKSMSIKDEFAAYSKLQRKIIKLKSELKDISQSRISKSLAIKSTLQIALQVVLALMMVVSGFWFRNVPVVALKGNLFPFSTVLRYPSELPNSISAHMWLVMSNVSIKILLRPFNS